MNIKDLILKRISENKCVICGKPIEKDFIMLFHPAINQKVKVCRYGHNIGDNQKE